VVTIEQILIRNLPPGTKAALRARAEQHHRSMEAEARELLAGALASAPASIVDLVSMDDGSEIEFQPDRLRLTVRTAQL
jgi:antitoxin FitA